MLRVAMISRRATKIEQGGFETSPYRNQLGIRRPVTIKQSDRTTIPLTWGVLRPIILLPADADDWTPDRMGIVLAHELAHVKRQDCLTQLLAQVTCALYWFHPLVWVTVARLRRECEQACDDRVLALGTSASDYAGHLVDLARSLQFSERWLPVVAMAKPRELETRVIALLDSRRRRGTVTRARAILCTIAMVLLILPLATLRAPAQARTAIAGSVFDATGAAVPRATVTLSNLDTGSRDTLSSNEEGSYAFVGIPAGRYALEVGKPGFKLFMRRDITVAANVPARLDPTLEVGGVNESVDVIGQNGRPPQSAPAAIPTRIRIGGNVQATKLSSQVKPVYSEILQQQGIEGTILLQAIIAKDGGLSALAVMNALANPDLAKAAVDAVKQWRYEPTLLNGNPVEVATTIKVNFKLK
jgi:TonB family protein